MRTELAVLDVPIRTTKESYLCEARDNAGSLPEFEPFNFAPSYNLKSVNNVCTNNVAFVCINHHDDITA